MDGQPDAAPLPSADALYERAPCGLLLTAPDGTILRVNRTFCDWLGRAPAELLGKVKVQDLLTMGGRLFHQTHWAPLMQIQGSVAEVKLQVMRGDGSQVPMVFNAVRRTQGEAIYHDIAAFVATDRHTYERELLTARRLAEEALAKEREAALALAQAQAERDEQKAIA